jgi:error-prone DNA polymerase
MEFAQCARAWGLRPITGAEVTLASGHHLTLLCESQQGYANLCRLLTHAHLEHERGKPCIEPQVLSRHPSTAPDGALRAGTEGLIALSGCRRGEVPSLVAQGRYREAEEAARRYLRWFGPGNFFIELQNNLVYGDARRNRALAELAEHLGVGVVATGNVHYHVRERHRLQDVLVAIRHRTTLDASHRLRRENSEYYLKPPAEMAALFRDYPEAVANTLRIAERCAFDLTRDLDYRFPDPSTSLRAGCPVPEGETPDSYLRKLCYRQAELKYGRITPQVRDRLERAENVVLVGPPGTGNTHLATTLALAACRPAKGSSLPTSLPSWTSWWPPP